MGQHCSPLIFQCRSIIYDADPTLIYPWVWCILCAKKWHSNDDLYMLNHSLRRWPVIETALSPSIMAPCSFDFISMKAKIWPAAVVLSLIKLKGLLWPERVLVLAGKYISLTDMKVSEGIVNVNSRGSSVNGGQIWNHDLYMFKVLLNLLNNY